MEIFKRNYSFEIRANEDKEKKNYTEQIIQFNNEG